LDADSILIANHPLCHPIESRDRADVATTDATHPDYFPIDELDPIILGEEADLKEAIEFLDGEQATLRLDHCHVDLQTDGVPCTKYSSG
jgi:hypothetical protein